MKGNNSVKKILQFVLGIPLGILVSIIFMANNYNISLVFKGIPEIYYWSIFALINLIIALLFIRKFKLKGFSLGYILGVIGSYVYLWYIWTYHFLDGV